VSAWNVREGDHNAIWAPETFTDFSKRWMTGLVLISKGQLGEKIKASTLWNARYALY
jgi:hypothetical protein